VFLPLKDKNNLRDIKFPFVNTGIIVLNVIIFLLPYLGFVDLSSQQTAITFGVVPIEIFGGIGKYPEALNVPENMTLISYMFLHGGLMHLGSNMVVLWVLGDNVEDALGHVKYLLFYILCGIFSALLHSLIMVESSIPLVGASGAAAGVIAAYLMLFPKAQIWGLLAGRVPLPLPAFIALGIWVITQLVSVVIVQDSNVAWWGHIGGLLAGAILVLFMRKKSFPLFNKSSNKT